MKQTKVSHVDRFKLRHQINGTPYPDNPNGLPYDNQGRLITTSKQKKANPVTKSELES